MGRMAPVKLENNPRFKLLKVEMPRIAQKLELFWGCPEFGPYVSHLMKDTRDGTRQGFPHEIANALLGLVEDHDYLFPKFLEGHGDVGGYKPDAEDAMRRSAPKFDEVADAIRVGKSKGPTDPRAAQQRKAGGSTGNEKDFEDVSVLCAGLLGFPDLDSSTPAAELQNLLHGIVCSRFDRLIAEHGLHKVKTVGELYVVSGGAQRHLADHLERCARLALAMRGAVAEVNTAHKSEIDVRVGLHAGPVTTGDVGVVRPSHDMWGEAVSLANGLESTGAPGSIQVTQEVRDRLMEEFEFFSQGRVDIPSAGLLQVYLLEGEKKAPRSWWSWK
jgi:class 3 adenylate cyclase